MLGGFNREFMVSLVGLLVIFAGFNQRAEAGIGYEGFKQAEEGDLYKISGDTLAADDLDAARFDTLRAHLDSLRKDNDLSGMAVSVVGPDSVLWSAGIGLAGRESDVPVTPQTLFRVGSSTKMFISMGLMRLVEQGRLDLQTPVREIAPEIPIENPWAETAPVRVIHLLEHTAGFDDMHFKKLFNREGPADLSAFEGLMAKMEKHRVRWRPGTRHSYSNPGYAMAGHIITKITGQPFDRYLKRTLLDPLNMASSSFTLTDSVRQALATGYSYADGKFDPLPYHPIYLRPAGSLCSSAEQMSQWVMMLLNRGSYRGMRIIADSSLTFMEQSHSTLAAKHGLKDAYGVGLYTQQINGWPTVGHDGGMPGFLSSVRYSKDLNRGFVILINGNSGMSEYREALTAFISEGAQKPKTPSVDLDAQKMKEFAGYYESRSPRNELLRFVHLLLNGASVSVKEDTLYVKEGLFGSLEKWVPLGGGTFRKPDESIASLVFAETDQYGKIMAARNTFHVKSADWKPGVFKSLLFGLGGIMGLTLLISLGWIFYALYKRYWSQNRRFGWVYISTMVLPLIAIASLVGAFFALTQMPMIDIGALTPSSAAFAFLTVIFALLAAVFFVLSIEATRRKKIPRWTRWHALVSSTALLLLAGYLTYWGVIGLRLWAY